MRWTIFRLWFCVWPLFLGVFLPYWRFPGGLQLMNVIWGIVYGLGLWGIDKTIGLSIQGPYVIFGAVLWPFVVSLAMFIFGGKVQHIANTKLRSAIVFAVVASSVALVSLDTALHPPFASLPTFYRLFFVAW